MHGVSTRKVDDLMKALGLDGLSKSEVSRIWGELDTVVAAFRTRPLTGGHRYVWMDATYHKGRVDGRVISLATVVAVGVTMDRDRQVLGIDVGAIPIEQDDEWAVAERRYFRTESMKLPTTPLLSTTTQEILAAIG